MPSVRQSTPIKFLSPQTASTAATNAWPVATLANSRIVVEVGLNNFQNDGIDVSGISDGAAFAEMLEVIRQATGHDAVTTRFWQHKNAAATRPAPTVTFTGLPGPGVNGYVIAHEVIGDDPALDTDPAATAVAKGATGNGLTGQVTIGPAERDCVAIGAVTTPNIQATSVDTAGDPYSQLGAGSTSAGGDSSKVTALTASYQVAAGLTTTFAFKVAGSLNRQYAAGVVMIPGPAGGVGGGGGAPRQFPLAAPDTTGYTVIPDPGIADAAKLAQPFNPVLSNTKDYVLACGPRRTAQLKIIGGRNVVVTGLDIKWPATGAIQNEMVYMAGGDPSGLVHFETPHLYGNGRESDVFKTHAPFSRDVQIRVVIGGGNAGKTATVHADFFQASGGVGDVWIEHGEITTMYQGLQLQREASLGPGAAKAATGWTRSGSVLTYTGLPSGHGIVADMYVSASGFSEAKVTGGFKVDSVTSTTVVVTLATGQLPAGTSGGAGTVQQMTFGYPVGGLNLRRVHIEGTSNPGAGSPSEALGGWRIGARTAPVGSSHPNEDKTPITDEAWDGTVTFSTDVYLTPPSGTIDQFVEPDANSWSTVAPTLNTATTPDQLEWTWPKVTGVVKLGPPASPMVVLVGGVPTPTEAGTPVTPGAPTNTTPPTLDTSQPTDAAAISLATIGGWTGTDSATTYNVKVYKRLAPSGSPSTVSTTNDLSEAAALLVSEPAAGSSGYQWRIGVVADNGTASSEAFTSWTSTVVPSPTITLTVTVQDDQGRAQIDVDAGSGEWSLVSVTRRHPSGEVWTVRGMDKADLVTASEGSSVLHGWDYELPIGRDVVYQAHVYADPNTQTAASAEVTVRWDAESSWIKDPLAPARNMPIVVLADGGGSETFETPTGVFQILGRPAPVTVAQVRQAATGTLPLRTTTLDEAARLHMLLASGRPLLLQTAPSLEYGNLYFAPLMTTTDKFSTNRPDRKWAIGYAENDPPVGNGGAFATYQNLLDVQATYQTVLDSYESYLQLLEQLDGLTARPELQWRGA